MYAVTPAATAGGSMQGLRPGTNLDAPASAAGAVGRGASAIASGSTPGLRVNEIQNAVGQMLRSIGGGLENDKLLQMMIALLILMQLLQESTGESAGRGSGQSRSLLPTTQGQGSFVMMSATSTTISVEQTSVYMVAGTGPAMLDAAPETPPTGSRMDVSA